MPDVPDAERHLDAGFLSDNVSTSALVMSPSQSATAAVTLARSPGVSTAETASPALNSRRRHVPPGHLDEPLGGQELLDDPRAAPGVDGDPLARRQVADDRFALDRGAALGQPDELPAPVLDLDFRPGRRRSAFAAAPGPAGRQAARATCG